MLGRNQFKANNQAYIYNIELKSKGEVINGFKKAEILDKIKKGYTKQALVEGYCKGKKETLENTLKKWKIDFNSYRKS